MGADLLRPVALDEAEIGDLVAHRPAHQPVHRLAQQLAERVPQGELDAGQDLVGVAPLVGRADAAEMLAVQPLDQARDVERDRARSGPA